MLTGSVSGAARLIAVTQPAVSRTLQHAEIQLGFPLFQRSRGRLVPTAEAQALYPHIERLFAQLDEVQRLAASLRSGESSAGQLRVHTVLGLSQEVLPRAVRLFRQKHPTVTLQHQALHSPQIVSSLVLQEADLGFVFSAGSHPALAQEQIGASRVMCIVPKGLLAPRLVKAGSVSFARLAGLALIALDSRDPLGLALAHALREYTQVEPVITVQTYHVALALAHHGVGVAMVDGCTAASADPTRVDVLALEPSVPVTVMALRPTARPNSLLTRAFTRCMAQALQQLPA